MAHAVKMQHKHIDPRVVPIYTQTKLTATATSYVFDIGVPELNIPAAKYRITQRLRSYCITLRRI